jgi:ACT domain-containing protein
MLIVHRDQEAKSMPKLIDVKEIIQGYSDTGILMHDAIDRFSIYRDVFYCLRSNSFHL